jgi:RHH-type proline utilization regulon transcriptional repressor/proline dehydrogenase/delta 1-pyrroline-5-carboxylate dehydrogenase
MSLSACLYEDEATNVERMLDTLNWDDDRAKRVEARAIELVERVRKAKRKPGELESFLQQFGLQSEEGLALMTLAEALLRIPDSHTADLLIKDKMVAADWLSKQGGSGGGDILTKAAGFGLSMTKKTLEGALSRVGAPVIRKALVEAMRMMGRQFVLGRTIEEGIKNGQAYKKKGYRVSYDMLGEGARTMKDADHYFEVYKQAISEIGKSVGAGPGTPGISVKLSALYPRYEFAHRAHCVPALTAKLLELAQLAAENKIALTVDAEEVDRLEMSLDIIEAVYTDASLGDWKGFGMAVQAYQKRCYALINRLVDMAYKHQRRFSIRLVKGAYWDTEIKRAQLMGLSDYPVYTRKVNTDLSFLTCAEKLMASRDYIYPMFATHNAQTVAAIMEMAGNDRDNFEFQRLHGMGETLHDLVINDDVANVTVYAPCGSHEDLLPYLVRRLLENGANSSFVYQILDENTSPKVIAADPVKDAANHNTKRHPHIPLPRDIYPNRLNSAGLDLTDEKTVTALVTNMKDEVDGTDYIAAPFVNGKVMQNGSGRAVLNPADKTQHVGHVFDGDDNTIDQAFITAKEGFENWTRTPATQRASALETLGDLMEQHHEELMGLCVREAGKTVEDALGEIREAVDFCRYYAMRGRFDFDEKGVAMPGPTGEHNVLTMHGRGTFVCISPWNFPLAIFVGQITAALMAGNVVISKPAEQTSLIAMRMAELIYEAGAPAEAFQIVTGGGDIGAKLVAHADVAGVAFTGSTEVARMINRALAAKDSAIVPLIAETGGQNAMIVDSSALPEQVIDDVLTSAFGAAGQRCSALRVLYVQDDVADKIIEMLRGAMAQQSVGDPMDLSSDLGPVIDEDALGILKDHQAKLDQISTKIAEVPLSDELKSKGHFFAPVAYEIESLDQLTREVFGPILHVIRYRADQINDVLAEINDTGYGLTCGVHSRISSAVSKVTENLDVGNAYVNRTTIGAVVGVQPFGGSGLSGTGPKAGGPHYLPRFATEKVVSTDTTRQGGNASLVTLTE